MSSIETARQVLAEMTQTADKYPPRDRELFAHVAGREAAALEGALWKPHAQEEGMRLASRFRALERSLREELQ